MAEASLLEGLSIKKKLNYTRGEAKPLDNRLIRNATDLYSFISQDIIESAPSFDKNYDWNPFKKELANRLINQANGPLYEFVSRSVLRYGPQAKEEMLAYLTNTSFLMPEMILQASLEEQASVAFFKQEITKNLPQTLVQQLNKDYGGSQRQALTAVEKTLAIPYAASNIPNERNRFANEIEALNKTIQKMLIEGISKELLIEQIEEWQALARQELFQNTALTHLEETPTAQGFALLNAGLGLKLSQIDTLNTSQMSFVHQQLQFNRTLIFDCLRESTLKLIKQDQTILSSNNFNHSDQYRSLQGVSGTPSYNEMVYHERLHYDKKFSLGTDSYIFEVLRNKQPNIQGIDYQNLTQYITDILSKSSKPAHTRAIIDIKGAFSSISNFAVAQEIAHYVKTSSAYKKPLKHVLYFNEEQVLCAINIQKPNQAIILGSSDTKVINRILGSSPEERFSYLDPIHSTGTDITQEETTHALVLVDDKTGLQEFLQASMRLRQLELHQDIEIIVPERMSATTLEQLYQGFKNNDEEALFKDTPSATKEQMHNYLRRYFLSLIQDIPCKDENDSSALEKKAVLINHFRPFFEENNSLDLFALYGQPNKPQAIKDLLDHYKKQLQQLWEHCLIAAEMKPYHKDIQAVSQHLDNIITKALPFCLKEYESNDDSSSLEVEVQKEVHKETQAETFTLEECYDPKLSPQRYVNWDLQKDYKNFFTTPNLKKQYTWPLNLICDPEETNSFNLFSDKLRVSFNYCDTYVNQLQFLNVFLKPVFLVWYHLDQNGLHATLITPQEAKQLKKNIADLSHSWIATTDDTIVGGTRPPEMLDDLQYQSLREQARFFNGEMNSLLNQDRPLNWLTEDSSKKLSFFSEQLMTLRPGSASGFRQLQSILTQGKAEGFAYISTRPFEDLTQFNWTSLFPKTLPKQAREYQKLAESFVYLNKHWYQKALTIEELQQQFNLAINSLAFLEPHLKHLERLRDLINHLTEGILDQNFLLKLNKQQKLCLEQCINISIERLKETSQEILEIPNINHEQLLTNVRILVILSLYPAVEHHVSLMPYFELQAKQAEFKELLLTLLEIKNPSKLFLQHIIENPRTDVRVITNSCYARSILSGHIF